jgi:hypothetical protein
MTFADEQRPELNPCGKDKLLVAVSAVRILVFMDDIGDKIFRHVRIEQKGSSVVKVGDCVPILA